MQTTPLTYSTTKPGYTDVTYMATVTLKFLDTQEMEGSTIPPVVWSGVFSNISKSKLEITKFANDSFLYMNFNYPEVSTPITLGYYRGNYSHTGIWYTKDNLRVIADVVPNSPAWKSGLRKGDEIKSINKIKVYPYYDKLESKYGYPVCNFYNMVMNNRLGGLRYLYLHANLDFKPYEEGVNTLDFIIKRHGKKLEFTVTPEAKWILVPFN